MSGCLPSLLTLLLLPGVSVEPETVPARGRQSALIRVEQPGMVHIGAESPEGTACSIVDHLRGPFQSSGRAGRENCSMDLLLDAGVYKLRMTSPRKGRHQVRISAKPFQEINDPVPRLPHGRGSEQVLHPGQQASYWIRVTERRWVTLQVFGRAAGLVRLWRDGKWVEEIETRASETMPVDGQPLYAWQVGGMLEPGDYRLTVYGASPKRWTRGTPRDELYVHHGHAPAPAEGTVAFSIPAWGQVSWEVPESDGLATFAELDRAPEADVHLRLASLVGKRGDQPGGHSGSCHIDKKKLIPVCAAWSTSESRFVVTVLGQPGTAGRLRWGGYTTNFTLADGQYTNARNSIGLEGPGEGRYLVAVHDVPVDVDAVPLGCVLDEADSRVNLPLDRDVLQLGPGRRLDRRVNYNGSEETLWFEVRQAGIYQVTTAGELENRCVLYRLLGGDRQVVQDSDPGATDCRFVGHLSPGAYELKIYGGKEGIETLKVACQMQSPFERAGKDAQQSLTKHSCLFSGVTLHDRRAYRLRLSHTGAARTRGLVLRKLPLALGQPLPLVLDPHARLELPVVAGREVVVRAAGTMAYTCGWKNEKSDRARDGVCRLSSRRGDGIMVIGNPGDTTIMVSAHRPTPTAEPPDLAAHDPRIRRLPKLAPDRARFFDFERGQSHSMIFDVQRAGLYHVTTRGLLATECRIRTAIVPRLVSDRGSGRGRNCLVSRFLRPGRYLLTVQTQGKSRGRASVVVSERPVHKQKSVRPGKEVFFRADADALIRQVLQVPKRARYAIDTTGQGVSLQCRLDDAEGWPLVAVPTSCKQTMRFDPGTYRWTQMPLTVESMRRTRLDRVRRPVVLRGDKIHRLRLNRQATAALGDDGKDRFGFALQAPLDLSVSLTNGMQGRIYRRGADGKRGDLVQPVPPGCATRVSLAAGRYLLETEHSRADVGIVYRVDLQSQILAPGIRRSMTVPSEGTVRMPADGVLRLKTSGESDVRCRLFDSAGQLVAESGAHGADWNCLIASPVAAGDYRLVLEAENTLHGRTEVSVVSTETVERGPLANATLYQPRGKVLLMQIPPPGKNCLQEIRLGAKLTFSYTVENGQGQTLRARENVRVARLLIHPRGEHHVLRLWSKNWRARIRARLASRPIQSFDGGRLPRGGAGVARIPRDGRYRTARGVWCLPAGQSGLLTPCGPEVSLHAGRVLLSAFGPEKSPGATLQEIQVELGTSSLQEELTSRHRIQRQTSKARALHLLQVSLPAGEPVAPACRLDGGISEQAAYQCYAVSAPADESVMRWWVPSRRARVATVWRHAARVPSRAKPLAPGVHDLVWSGEVARWSLPAEPVRIELALPAGTWVVRTDAGGSVIDMCTPRADMSTCRLAGTGGELLVAANASRRMRAHLVAGVSAATPERLDRLVETAGQAPGTLRLQIDAAAAARFLDVKGAGRCLLAFADGTRVRGCHQTVPAGRAAELQLDQNGGPVRAVLCSSGDELASRWGQPLPSGQAAPLEQGRTASLEEDLVLRSLAVEQPVVMHLDSDSGVCGLVGPAGKLLLVDGFGAGCHASRLLEPGSYRLLVRPFGGRRLAGGVSWTTEPVIGLHEGVGREAWIMPGETRLFRFVTEAPGEVGLGIRARADLLGCSILDEGHALLGTGCQQLIELDKGSYLLRIQAPPGAPAVAFRPVLLGLSGSVQQVPEEYLRDFFRRIGEMP